MDRKSEFTLIIQDESKLTPAQKRYLKFSHLIDLDNQKKGSVKKVNFMFFSNFLKFVAMMDGRVMIDKKNMIVLNGCVDFDY